MDYRKLKIRDIPIIVTVANTPTLRERGLMGVERLSPNEGCLFCFGMPQYTNFWMRNCKINLQAATINQDGQIIDIHDMSHADPYYVHKSSQPVTYVLEMPEGFFTANKIAIGDKIDLSIDIPQLVQE